MENKNDEISWALQKIAHYHSQGISDTLLQTALINTKHKITPDNFLYFCKQIQWGSPSRLRIADEALIPLLHHSPEYGWSILLEKEDAQIWKIETKDGIKAISNDKIKSLFSIKFTEFSESHQKSFDQTLKDTFKNYRGVLTEGVIASVFLSLLALAASLYSMQVYDRVIPLRGTDTLLILTIGLALGLLVELAMKVARAHLVDAAALGIDAQLSRKIFERLVSIRLEELPTSVGSLASQLRSYEQIRSFYTSSTMFALADIPLACIFIVIISVLGTPWLASIPLLLALFALLLGWSRQRRLHELALAGALASNRKTGILVETVEGAETIKAGNGGWKFLAKWLHVSNEAMRQDHQMRQVGELTSYLSASLQQIGYVGIVALGALTVIRGDMSMGALIACSIIGGRVMAPIVTLPAMMVQYAHAQAARRTLQAFFKLGIDYQDIKKPLFPALLRGDYELKSVNYCYSANIPALSIDQLKIYAGEKVGILGAIGSGKSTLLKVISGLYRPTQGRVLLDGLDIKQIHRQALGKSIGFLQQDHRLFEGTLRDNLFIGMVPPSDDIIAQALAKSGLSRLVAAHPRGLDLPIFEGGKGLSGGQRQLVAFTRLLLAEPRIFLLDEPTANMDSHQESMCLDFLMEQRATDKTMVVVTHKPSLLKLVDRLVVMVEGKVVLDGPRDKVLAHLTAQQSAEHRAVTGN